MTFKESEYPGLLDEIRAVARFEKNPAMALERILELIRLNDRIPLYPGLVGLVGKGSVAEVEAKDVKAGDVVAFTADDTAEIHGTVAKLDGRDVALKNFTRAIKGPEGYFSLPDKVKRIEPEALEKSWPSLVFGKGK